MTIWEERLSRRSIPASSAEGTSRGPRETIARLRAAIADRTRRVGRVLHVLQAKENMRLDLLDLDQDRLIDIGVTRDQALRAAERIAWRNDWN